MSDDNIADLSTNLDEIKWLGHPQHKNYQQSWQKFHERYHDAIMKYIMRVSGWTQQDKHKAEEVLSLVYEKGFRWTFRRDRSVKFRIVLQRLVKDSVSEYFRRQNKFIALADDVAIEGTPDHLHDFSLDVLETIINKILSTYSPRESIAIKYIWEYRKWPESQELAALFQCNNDTARKWKQRHFNCWKKFQQQVVKEIENLVWGETEKQQEVLFFTQLQTNTSEEKS